MSYTPTEWESADIVTATRMNKLETAVGDMAMSYTPNTWSDGDILTADKMNALEQAVASGGGGSSDFSTAEVTISGELSIDEDGKWFIVLDNGVMYATDILMDCTAVIVLYQGSLEAEIYNPGGAGAVVTTGDASVTTVSRVTTLTITGDCTITIS
jgi:hypothetical protein